MEKLDEEGECILNMTDEEVIAACVAEGKDPAVEAERVRNILRTAVFRKILDDAFNDAILDLADIAWANGSIDAGSQRQLAEDIGRHIKKGKESAAAQIARCFGVSRTAVIEQCAKVAEEEGKKVGYVNRGFEYEEGKVEMANTVANAIRKLAESPQDSPIRTQSVPSSEGQAG